ncbi:MAG: heme-binding domain-containing protein [Bacteroidetes bacterium]|nr:heme-binding domain-containing protein [Bacteroidota bacterium]
MKKFFRKILAKKKQIGITLLIILVVIQFIRPVRNSGNSDSPNDITHATAVSADVKTILETSCYDCHSDHTVYPWYTNIQPVGWWLARHVHGGKRTLNFSQFNSYCISRKMDKFKAISDEVNDPDGMPLNSYLWIHRYAKLSDTQKKIISDWAMANRKTMEQQYPDSIPVEEPE